jgi:hypothetical protein
MTRKRELYLTTFHPVSRGVRLFGGPIGDALSYQFGPRNFCSAAVLIGGLQGNKSLQSTLGSRKMGIIWYQLAFLGSGDPTSILLKCVCSTTARIRELDGILTVNTVVAFLAKFFLLQTNTVYAMASPTA